MAQLYNVLGINIEERLTFEFYELKQERQHEHGTLQQSAPHTFQYQHLNLLT